jgi:hypothetical protein
MNFLIPLLRACAAALAELVRFSSAHPQRVPVKAVAPRKAKG